MSLRRASVDAQAFYGIEDKLRTKAHVYSDNNMLYVKMWIICKPALAKLAQFFAEGHFIAA